MRTRPGATHLECTACGESFDADALAGLSSCCAKPLYPRYDLAALRGEFTPARLAGRRADLWRYEEVLPVRDAAHRISLGEGWTPLLDAGQLARSIGFRRVLIKDEGLNPTGSFKARGLCMAISRAKELGVREVAIPTAGNAGSAAAAYAAAAGMRVHVFAPRDTPRVIVEEMRALGAELRLVDGLITDAAALVAEGVRSHGWFDLSTLKEPYRVEGKKTMGYELFEQLGGRLPRAIVYPTGGGTGLVGMWKAFEEMAQLGWIGDDETRPRMISVQASGCAPIVKAWQEGAAHAEPWPDARTAASGLRVPRAVGDFLMLNAIRASRGAAIAVEDEAMRDAQHRMGAATGVFASPEGAAPLAALPLLQEQGLIDPEEEVVLFNTGSGLKYVDVEA